MCSNKAWLITPKNHSLARIFSGVYMVEFTDHPGQGIGSPHSNTQQCSKNLPLLEYLGYQTGRPKE